MWCDLWVLLRCGALRCAAVLRCAGTSAVQRSVCNDVCDVHVVLRVALPRYRAVFIVQCSSAAHNVV